MAFNSPEKILLSAEKRLRPHFIPLTKEEILILRQHLDKFQDDRPKFRDFTQLYGEPIIQEDRAVVEKILKSIESSEENKDKINKFYADVLEMIFANFARVWLPGSIAKVSLFDDIKRGIDLVLEFDKPPMHLAIDVTFDEREVLNKIEKIVNGYGHGIYPETKYFRSGVNREIGSIKMPEVVVGTEKSRLIEFAKLFVELKNSEDPETGNKKEANRINRIMEAGDFGHRLRNEIIKQLNLTLLTLDSASISVEREMAIKNVTELIRVFTEFDENKKAPESAQLMDRIEEAIQNACDSLSESYKPLRVN